MSEEKIKISELPLVSSYINLYTIGTDGSLNSVKVPLFVLNQIGDLSQLTTQDKSSLVAAINEIAENGGGDAPFSQVAVVVTDNTPGTPYGEATIANDTLTLTFHHLKGDPGDSSSITGNVAFIGLDEGSVAPPFNYLSRFILDKYGNTVLPITHERNIWDADGVRLDVKLAALTSKVSTIAWDGASIPQISRIPAGVTVTYQGQNYTGTMPPSAATDGITYLIKDGNEYDRYVSSLSVGGTYVWVPLGSTAIGLDIVDNLQDGGRDKALSAEQGKVLKGMIEDQFVFLTQEEWEALSVIEPGKLYCTYEVEEEEL